MLKKVFNGVFLKRLDNIIQWQDKDVIFKESVSSHSYKVSVFCTLILDEIFGLIDYDIISLEDLNNLII